MPWIGAFTTANIAMVLFFAACNGDDTASSTTAAAITTVVTTVPDSGVSTTNFPVTTTTPVAMAPVTTVPVTTPAAIDPLDVTARAAVVPVAATTAGSIVTPDGRARTYHVYVPASLGEGVAAPLLIALHGGTGWGLQFERNSGFDGLAEANGFIVVYPDGVGVGATGTDLRTWNGGACCGPAVRQAIDDVDFIRQLIEEMEAAYAIDPQRVFAAGHSNGGMLALRLACELSDRIVAIGVQSSALEIPECAPAEPVAVLQIHGAADMNVPIGGGVGPNALSGVSFMRPFDAAATLALANGCPNEPLATVSPTNADATVSAWAPCAGRTQVVFVEVAGAGHAWMGHAAGGSGAVGPPYPGMDASLVIWNFLAAYPRP